MDPNAVETVVRPANVSDLSEESVGGSDGAMEDAGEAPGDRGDDWEGRNDCKIDLCGWNRTRVSRFGTRGRTSERTNSSGEAEMDTIGIRLGILRFALREELGDGGA